MTQAESAATPSPLPEGYRWAVEVEWLKRPIPEDYIIIPNGRPDFDIYGHSESVNVRKEDADIAVPLRGGFRVEQNFYPDWQDAGWTTWDLDDASDERLLIFDTEEEAQEAINAVCDEESTPDGYRIMPA